MVTLTFVFTKKKKKKKKKKMPELKLMQHNCLHHLYFYFGVLFCFMLIFLHLHAQQYRSHTILINLPL